MTLAACSRSTTGDGKSQATPAPAAAASQATLPAAPAPEPPAKPVPAQLPDVLARFNGEAIQSADLENRGKGLHRHAGGPVPANRRDPVIRGVLSDMMTFRFLWQAV